MARVKIYRNPETKRLRVNSGDFQLSFQNMKICTELFEQLETQVSNEAKENNFINIGVIEFNVPN